MCGGGQGRGGMEACVCGWSREMIVRWIWSEVIRGRKERIDGRRDDWIEEHGWMGGGLDGG